MCSPDLASPSAGGRDGAFPSGLLKVGLGSSFDEPSRAQGTEQVTERVQFHPLSWGLMLPVRGRAGQTQLCKKLCGANGCGLWVQSCLSHSGSGGSGHECHFVP